MYAACGLVAASSLCCLTAVRLSGRQPVGTITGVFALSLLSALSPLIALRLRRPHWCWPFVVVQVVVASLIVLVQLLLIEVLFFHLRHLRHYQVPWERILLNFLLMLVLSSIHTLAVLLVLRARIQMKSERKQPADDPTMFVVNPNEEAAEEEVPKGVERVIPL